MSILILFFLLAAVVLVVALVLVVLILQRRKMNSLNLRNQESLRKQEHAVFATAQVVHSEGGIPSDGASQVRVTLTLEVTPPGGEPYRAHTVWLVNLTALSSVQEGMNIAVKIDQENFKVIYPNSTWAKYIQPE